MLKIDTNVQNTVSPTITVHSTLLCPAVYFGKQNTVSTFAFNIHVHLFNFPLLICYRHILVHPT